MKTLTPYFVAAALTLGAATTATAQVTDEPIVEDQAQDTLVTDTEMDATIETESLTTKTPAMTVLSATEESEMEADATLDEDMTSDEWDMDADIEADVDAEADLDADAEAELDDELEAAPE